MRRCPGSGAGPIDRAGHRSLHPTNPVRDHRHVRPLALLLLAAACAAPASSAPDTTAVPAGESATAAAPAPAANCPPLETRPPNAAAQQPAFEGQTRACGVASSLPYDVQVVATGLANAWAVEPLPDGRFLVTEKPGQMRIVSAAGELGAPITGVPAVDARRQGGLLDVALSPSFATDRTIFWSFTEPREGGNGTSVARGRLSADMTALEDVRVILRTRPTYENNMHFGSRLAFGPDGMLYVTMGERSAREMREQAQQLDSHLGKILRITPDGAAPQDNPFVGREGALPEIWSLGHRNIQAATFDPQGRLWSIEHGTRGGDELNLIEAGNNYGWPIQAYGVEYNGQPIAVAEPQRPNTEQPVYYWDPVIAPSGAEVYEGNAFPDWQGDLFVGGLASQRLVRLEIANGRVAREEHLLTDRSKRIRDVREGPNGHLYVVTDGANGELWRIVPRG